MIQQPAPDILRHWRQRNVYLYIPGGWLMTVPEYHIESDFQDAYIQWYLKDGLSFARAEAAVKHTIQEHAAAGFRASLLASITYYAKVYADMYPERLKQAAPAFKDAFTPVGYDPATMQTVHVPGYRSAGSLPAAKKILLEMGEAA